MHTMRTKNISKFQAIQQFNDIICEIVAICYTGTRPRGVGEMYFYKSLNRFKVKLDSARLQTVDFNRSQLNWADVFVWWVRYRYLLLNYVVCLR